MHFLIFLLMLACLFLIASPLTGVFHELGHAIPAILLTGRKVTIYIGSYGNPAKSVRFNIGLLEVYFSYNPFLWWRGLCVPSADDVSLNRRMIYVVTGPVTSLIIATIACYFAFTYDLHGFFKLFLVVFLGSSFLDLIMNLIPRKTPVKLYSGKIVFNDGYCLKQLLYLKRLPKEYPQGAKLYNEKLYSEAAVFFDKMLANGANDPNIYRLAISSYLQDKNYERAKNLSEEFAQVNELTSEDLSAMALSYSQLGQHEKGLELYDRSLNANPDNTYSLNNKGYTLNLLNRYEEAILLFNRAIELDENFAYSYSNRGLSKIKIGRMEEGLADINYSLELDKDNSYGYRNLGIYHFAKGDYNEALRLFIKAKDLDETTHSIEELITAAKKRVD